MDAQMLAEMEQMMAKNPEMEEALTKMMGGLGRDNGTRLMEQAMGMLSGSGAPGASPKVQSTTAPKAQPATTPKAPSEDPFLASLLDPVRIRKDRGADLFKVKKVGEALEAYREALVAGDSCWPQVEALLVACRSNVALCLLQLGRPVEAIRECDLALASPSIHTDAALLSKVLARKLQGLIDAKALLATGTRPVDLAAERFLHELRVRGCFAPQAPGHPKFIEQAARLCPPHALGGSAAARAFEALACRWLDARTLDRSEVDAARGRLHPKATAASKQPAGDAPPADAALLRELGFLAAKPPDTALAAQMKDSTTLKEVIGIVSSCFASARAPAGCPMDQALFCLRFALRGGMHPSHAATIEPQTRGSLIWALVASFEDDPFSCSDEATEMFVTLLDFLAGEAKAPIDQRHTLGQRTPLMYVARTGNARALRAMLSNGADVNLRDSEGWTALMCACMDNLPNAGAKGRDGAACLRLMLDASADVGACNLVGTTALVAAASQTPPPFEEICALLAAGADPSLRTRAGDSPISIVERSRHKTPAISEAVLERLQQAAGEQGVAELHARRFLHLYNQVLVPAHNEGVNEQRDATKRAAQEAEARAMTFGERPSAALVEGFREREEQERRVLAALLNHMGMDEALVARDRPMQASDGNWLFELHRRVEAAVPAPFRTVYLDAEPSNEELALMLMDDDDARREAAIAAAGGQLCDDAKLRSAALTDFRDRGRVSRAWNERIHRLIVDPICHVVGFGVPSEDALRTIAKHGPLVEMGAGTGYWAAILQHRGVDVEPYDLVLPDASLANQFFYDSTFTTVAQCDARGIFRERPELASRALLLVWPNNPDALESPKHAASHGGPQMPIWDAECLEAYLDAGGHTVVYVGEREATIRTKPGAPSDSGVTATRRFQSMLSERLSLVEAMPVPNWCATRADDLTVWERRVSG